MGKKRNKWAMLSFGSLIISEMSIFTTIVKYRNAEGISRAFSILDFISTNDFDSFVISEYHGTVVFTVNTVVIRILILIGLIAIACAVAGVAMLSKQKNNTLSFFLALAGLIGTMLPAVTIFLAILIWQKDYSGTMTCGIYPIVSPIAMIICIITTTEMFRCNRRYKKNLKAAEGMIYRAKDL